MLSMPTPRSIPRHTLSPPAAAGVRLAKRVAEMRGCSRAQAEQIIEGGCVRVDGVVVEEPQFRVAEQTVTIDADASPLDLAPVTLLLHKPPGVHSDTAHKLLNPAAHAADDTAPTRVLKRHFAKLVPGAPLEPAASGLMVFTQDWRVARKLEEDASTLEHELLVEVAGAVSPEALNQLHYGFGPDRQSLPPHKASIGSASETSTKLRFAIKGSHPGLLAYLCERAGLRILGLKRLRMGRVSMAQLPVGQWRYLQGYERF